MALKHIVEDVVKQQIQALAEEQQAVRQELLGGIWGSNAGCGSGCPVPQTTPDSERVPGFGHQGSSSSSQRWSSWALAGPRRLGGIVEMVMQTDD